MNEKVKAILEELVMRYPSLAGQKAEIAKAYEILKNSYDRGGKLLIAGNGGSCADSEHIVGELMKGFCKKRPLPADLLARIAAADPDPDEMLSSKLQQGLPAIALTGHNALSTAFVNDVDAEYVFAQQIVGYGRQGDVFLGITTSGNSRNVLRAAAVAKAMELQVIALTGRDGGRIRGLADCAVVVPEQETFRIQELHLPVYHALCLMLEETYFTV